MGFTPFDLQKLGFDATITPGAGSGTLTTVKDEGSTLSSAAVSIDFTGSGVTATNVGTAITVDIPGGGSSLSPSYHLTDYGATTTYSGVNSSSSSPTDANWSITKLVLSGNGRETRTVYTATDQWVNRSTTASYTTSLAYSN